MGVKWALDKLPGGFMENWVGEICWLSEEEEEEPYLGKQVFDALPVSTPFVPLYPTYRSVSRSFGLRSSYEIDTDQRPRNKSTAEPIFNYCFIRLSTSGRLPGLRG